MPIFNSNMFAPNPLLSPNSANPYGASNAMASAVGAYNPNLMAHPAAPAPVSNPFLQSGPPQIARPAFMQEGMPFAGLYDQLQAKSNAQWYQQHPQPIMRPPIATPQPIHVIGTPLPMRPPVPTWNAPLASNFQGVPMHS